MLNELWKYFQINDSPSQEGTVYGISATTSNYDKSNVQVGDVIEFHISRGCGQKTGLPRTPKGAGSLCILRTKSTSHYRFITSAVL